MIKDITQSIKNYYVAFKLINQLKLWKYFLIPVLIGLVLGIVFISSAYSFSDNLGGFLSKYWKWDFGKGFITGLSSWLAGFVILILGIILYKHLLMALAAPFMSPVSEKVEAHLTNTLVKNTSNFTSQLIRGIKVSGTSLIKELLIILPLMILSFIPLIGLIAVVLIFYYQSYFVGIGNMDYTLERHLTYKESKVFMKKHKSIAVGNGLIFTLMLFIPIVGIMITLPIATVASTIDTVKKLKNEGVI